MKTDGSTLENFSVASTKAKCAHTPWTSQAFPSMEMHACVHKDTHKAFIPALFAIASNWVQYKYLSIKEEINFGTTI